MSKLPFAIASLALVLFGCVDPDPPREHRSYYPGPRSTPPERNKPSQKDPDPAPTTPPPVSTQTPRLKFQHVAVGVAQTCAVADRDRDASGRGYSRTGVWCWGANDRAQLGDGTRADHATPTDTGDVGDHSHGSIFAIALGRTGGCVQRAPYADYRTPPSSFQLQCWGENDAGQVGDGTHEPRIRAVDLPRTNFFAAAPSPFAVGPRHACAPGYDDKGAAGLFCWGANDHGQLGDAQLKVRDTPNKVAGLEKFEKLDEIAVGEAHTCARSAGAVACWGSNVRGELGAPAGADVSAPRVLALAGPVAQLALGNAFTCARMADATVQCWGENEHGELGDKLRTPRATPAPVVGLTDVTSISAAGTHVCALRKSGDVWCWGGGGITFFGEATEAGRTLAAPRAGLEGVVEIAVGPEHACARGAGNVIRCWGRNDRGQLGDGTTIDRVAPVPLEIKGSAKGTK